MTWTDYIHADPAIAAGKPVVKGTRLAVDFLVELFGKGWTREEVLQAYPQLTPHLADETSLRLRSRPCVRLGSMLPQSSSSRPQVAGGRSQAVG